MALEAFRYSHTKAAVLVVFSGSTQVSENDDPLGISGGSITVDRNQKARRSLSCTVPLTQWQDPGQRWPWEDPVPIDVFQTRIEVWLGYDLGAYLEVVPAGTFRVDELGRTSNGELSISGTSLESYVIENTVLDESEYAKAGDNCIDSIKALITACFSTTDAPVFDVTPAAQAMAGVTLATDLAVGDRWDLIESYAFAIDCAVYCAPDGKFRIDRIPDVDAGKPVWRINEGADGVLVSMSTNVTRDPMYNGVQVITQSSDSGVPPISGKMVTVADLPGHPLAGIMDWGGKFGKKPFVYTDSSGMLTTSADCNRKAEALLKEMLAEERTLDLSAIPNPALEPDDIVEILTYHPVTGAEIIEKHMLTTMTIPLGLGEWSAGTLSNKTSEDLNDDSPLKPPQDA